MQLIVGSLVALSVAINTVLVCIPLYVLGLVRLLVPIPWLRRKLAYPMDTVIDVWVSGFHLLIRCFRLVEINVDFPPGFGDRKVWQVIMCNHQSWVDIVILQASFRHVAPVLKFFTKKELIWVPFVGVAMWFLGFPYVYRPKSSDQHMSESRRVVNEAVLRRESARFLDKPVAVINFVEGTRFTPAKRDARGSNFKHLLNPRRGGLHQTLVALDEKVDTVLNATIRYDGVVPDFWDLLCGRTNSVHLTVEEIPKPSNDHDTMTLWLNDCWRAKDAFLSHQSSPTASAKSHKPA